MSLLHTQGIRNGSRDHGRSSQTNWKTSSSQRITIIDGNYAITHFNYTCSVLFFSIYSRTLSFVRIARSNYMYLVRSLHMLAIFIPVNVNTRLLQNNVIGLFDFYKYIL